MITLRCKLDVKEEDFQKLKALIKNFSLCVRHAYRQFLKETDETIDEKSVRKHLKSLIQLNSRYQADALFRARILLTSLRKRNLNPTKTIFGTSALFTRLKKGRLTKEERNELGKRWKERRQGNLYSRGDRTHKGNLNLRFVFLNGHPYLRINTGGRREWIYAKVIKGDFNEPDWIDFLWQLEQARMKNAYFPYSVWLSLRDGQIFAFVSYEEEIIKSPSIYTIYSLKLREEMAEHLAS